MDLQTAKELDLVFKRFKEKVGAYITDTTFKNDGLRLNFDKYIDWLIKLNLIELNNDNGIKHASGNYYKIRVEGLAFDGFENQIKKERFSKTLKNIFAILVFVWGAYFTVSDRINDGKKETLDFEIKVYKKHLLLIPKIVNEINSSKNVNTKSDIK